MLATSLTSASHAAPSEAQKLGAIFDSYWKWRMADSPEEATWNGYPGQNDRWQDLSPQAIEHRHQEVARYLAKLDQIARPKLPATEQTSFDVFKYDLTNQVEAARYPEDVLQLTQLNGIHIDPAQLFNASPTATAKDMENLLARLRGFPARMDQTIALLESGLKQGITPPRITLRDVPEQIHAQIVEQPEKSPLFEPFKKKPEYQGEAKNLIATKVVPAYRKLLAFINDQYLPGTRETTAFTAVPRGKDWYELKVRANTTTRLTAQEIHEIGLSEVKRIRAQMDQIITSVGFKGDFKAFSEYLRTDARFYFGSREALLKECRDIAKRIDPELIRLFGKLPRLPYGVSPVPEYSEKSAPGGYYEPGSLMAGRPGVIYINTYDLKSRPSWALESLIAHESVPGHHLQGSIALEMDKVPEFRKFGWYTAYGEGWALYAESLGAEIGLYKDPFSEFGHLGEEMLRAVRLVVDTGMHALGWSRQRAIDYFLANSPTVEHEVIVEIDRYLVWPGQALGYKIGQLKIKELREKWQKELGPKFDLRSFHDAALANGAVPLDVLEKHLAEWAAERRKLKSGT
jgi:uncharacterized protein (DUF885 family)